MVAWTRTALAFGPRTALVTAVALLVYPGYGILFHTPASEPVAAAVSAAWALAVTRAWVAPSYGRFAVVGAATAAAALARPAFQVLVLVAALPLFLRLPWRARLGCATSCAGIALALLGSWTVANGLRYDDYTVARGTGAFFPFYRAFTTTTSSARPTALPRGSSPTRCRRELLPEEPYRSYGVTLDEFFERGGPREFEDVVGITDRLWGWSSDYSHMRDVGVEAVEAHPLPVPLRRGEDDLRGALEAALRCASQRPRRGAERDVGEPNDRGREPATAPGLPVPSDGEVIPAARQGFFSTTPDGRIRERWTSPVDHALVFATQEMQRRYDEAGRDAAAG